MKANFNIERHSNGEVTLVFEEVVGIPSADSCPYRVYSSWESMTAALRLLGITEVEINKAKQTLDFSTDHQAIIKNVYCSAADMVTKAGFEKNMFA